MILLPNTKKGKDDLAEFSIAFLFGVIFGSFGNVLIYRVPKNLSIIKPSSFCPACSKKIRFYHNIPIISWILLRGRCSNCHSKISFLYPTIEFLSGILGVMVVFKAGFNLYALFIFLVFFLFLVLSVIDIKYKAVPDSINFSALFFAVIYGNIVFNIQNAFLGAGFLVLLKYLLEFLLNKEALGEADVIVFASISAILTFEGSFLAIFIASITALPFALYFQYKKQDTQIPFVPFLTFGAFVGFLIA